jgi:hypothetical protein
VVFDQQDRGFPVAAELLRDGPELGVRQGLSDDVNEASLRKAWADRYEVKTRREREWIV